MNQVLSLMKRSKKYYFLVVSFLLCISNLQSQTQGSLATKPSNQEVRSQEITYEIIEAPNKTFGYNIMVDKKIFIHQASVPGRPGKQGFVRQSDAEKVAMLTIKKMYSGLMPPTIVMKELNSLKVKYWKDEKDFTSNS